MSWLSSLFSGGLVSSIEKVALEAIDTTLLTSLYVA
jgi:hypothetical protein